MSEKIKVAKLSDVPAGKALAVKVEREYVALFNLDGKIVAISDMCPHAGGPLSEGQVENGQVICPWHGWQFDIDLPEGAPDDGIDRYPVEIRDGEIWIEKD
jgi:nitrite reductase (NADH) small subunit